KQRRRQRLRAQPFPPAWRSIITGNLPIFRRLPPEDQAELLGHVQVFLAEKRFEGCSGLELTDEIRVTIAAQACLLLLHRATDYYPELTSILVYPSGYTSYEARHLEGNIWDEGGDPRLGQTARRLGTMRNAARRIPRMGGTWSCTSSRISSTTKSFRQTARQPSPRERST